MDRNYQLIIVVVAIAVIIVAGVAYVLMSGTVTPTVKKIGLITELVASAISLSTTLPTQEHFWQKMTLE